MAQFWKMLVLAGLAALIAAPACAAKIAHGRAFHRPHHKRPGFYGFRSSGGYGLAEAPNREQTLLPDRDEAIPEPTGLGAITNAPPARRPVLLRAGPHIITLSGRHFHHPHAGRTKYKVIVRRGVLEPH